MRELQIISGLQKSLDNILPIAGLKIAIQSSPSVKSAMVANLEYRGLSFDAVIEVVSAGSLSLFMVKIYQLKSITVEADQVPVLAAPYLSPQRQKLCRDNGICYVDLSGNVFLAYRSFYVEKVGLPNKFPEKRQRRNPFSDKASLILRELLKDSARQWGTRELAHKLDLNPGYVSRMSGSLEEMGYISKTKGKLKVRAQKEILDDWVSAYDYKKNDLHRFFCMAESVEAIIGRLRNLQIPGKIKYALSIQAGASLVAPHAVFKEVHMYVEDSRGIDFFSRAMELQESDRGTNFVLMLPYYKHSFYYDQRLIDGLPVVADIQLYIDLYKYPLRGREQAEYLYNKRLKSIFGEI